MSCICEDCGLEYDAFDGHMVMLHFPLWEVVSCGDTLMCLCDECIEKRLGRALGPADLTDAPVNSTYLRCRK